mmetsp:Transcript_83213/g.160750  ORF Transcript_83213/g.160750 Transcript_83213/m.160750 type:complete len:186 (-) Transcript_83213:517-1074(-)
MLPDDGRVTNAIDVLAALDVLSANEVSFDEELQYRAAPDVGQAELIVVFGGMLLLVVILVLPLLLLLLPLTLLLLVLPSKPRRLVVVADRGGVVVVLGVAAMVPNAFMLSVLVTVPRIALACFGAIPSHTEAKSSQQFPYFVHSAVHWQGAPFLKEPQPYALQVTAFKCPACNIPATARGAVAAQ